MFFAWREATMFIYIMSKKASKEKCSHCFSIFSVTAILWGLYGDGKRLYNENRKPESLQRIIWLSNCSRDRLQSRQGEIGYFDIEIRISDISQYFRHTY